MPALTKEPVKFKSGTDGLLSAILIPSEIEMNEFPGPSPLPSNQPVVARVILWNNQTKPVVLKVSNKFAENTWLIRDSSGVVVQSHTNIPMIFQPQELTLLPGLSTVHDAVISLEHARYEDGKEYILEYHFWGVVIQAKFTVHKLALNVK